MINWFPANIEFVISWRSSGTQKHTLLKCGWGEIWEEADVVRGKFPSLISLQSQVIKTKTNYLNGKSIWSHKHADPLEKLKTHFPIFSQRSNHLLMLLKCFFLFFFHLFLFPPTQLLLFRIFLRLAILAISYYYYNILTSKESKNGEHIAQSECWEKSLWHTVPSQRC